MHVNVDVATLTCMDSPSLHLGLQKPKGSTGAALSNYCHREIWKRVGCRGFWEGNELTAAELSNIFLCEQQNKVNLII